MIDYNYICESAVLSPPLQFLSEMLIITIPR